MYNARTQIAAAFLSFASIVGLAAGVASNTPMPGEVQSFVGTTPNATALEEQPATF